MNLKSEKVRKILNIDKEFLLRDIRNEIANEYEDEKAMEILNSIYKYKSELSDILEEIKKTIR